MYLLTGVSNFVVENNVQLRFVYRVEIKVWKGYINLTNEFIFLGYYIC